MTLVFLAACSSTHIQLESLTTAQVVPSLFPSSPSLALYPPVSARVCNVAGEPPPSVSVTLAELQGQHDNLVRIVIEERTVLVYRVPTVFGRIERGVEVNTAGRPTWVDPRFLVDTGVCFDVSGVPADRQGSEP